MLLLLCISLVSGNSDFGGDFSANGLSGSSAPGATSNTMGNTAASAMAIGTGSSGTGDYASNFKTPNFTQYTQQDFKEFMPNYQEMMNTTMGAMTGAGGSGGSGSSFANFTSVNVMLKGFMELQKEQLEVEKAKAEASRAKMNLALEKDDYEDEEELDRRKRSLKRTKNKEAADLALPLSSLSSTTKGIALLKAASATFRQKGDKLIRLKPAGLPKRQVSDANWGSSADNWMEGDIKKWGKKSRQNSRKAARQFGSWPGMPGSSSKRDTQTSSQDSAGGAAAGGKNFWANFGSMFNGATGTGSPTGGGGKTSGSWSNSSPSSSGSAGSSGWPAAGQGSGFPPPSSTNGGFPSGATPQGSYMMPQGSSSGGASATSPGFTQQGNQRRSLMMSPASSSPGGYPVHGALALSNVPDESSYQENIPDLSFSLRPPSTPAPIEAPEKEVPESNLLMTAPQPTRLGYLMPTSYQEPPTYVQMANPAILRRPTLLNGGPTGYKIVDNGPIMLEESGNFVYVNPDRGQMIPSSRVLVAREASKEPLVISMTNGDNEDAVKKIVLDPDNGIVVTQDKTRKKRSTAEDETESTTVKSQDHEATEDEPPKKAGTESDPNGHSHGVENNFKSSSEGMEAMMKPFMGFSKLFSARNSPSRDERRVKIDFLQNGEELPEGTVESISAGGGKAPGHHEGGGLTVKVNEKIEPRKATSSQQKPRKTLNFYFTW